MLHNARTDQQANVAGGLLMIASMAAFAVEDVFVKLLAQTLPVGQILIMFGIGGTLIFTCLAGFARERLWTPEITSRPMMLRVAFEILGRLFYVLAIALTPLSAATVILQATPVVVVAGAAIVFSEKVGWRRWSAIVIGLLGVVVVVQPGSGSFSMLSILAVLGMLGFAGRDLASRAAPSSVSTNILGVYGFLSVIASGILVSVWEPSTFVWPDTGQAVYLLVSVVTGVLAYGLLMKAMRTGEVSAVTPFRYTRLLFGICFGVLLFDEQFTRPMLIGCALIVFSGAVIIARKP